MNKPPKTPRPPAYLSEPTRRWWRDVVRSYALEPHHIHLLNQASGCLDRIAEAKTLLARDGLTIEGREGGLRPHPAVAIERDNRILFSRLLRELDLDTEPSTGSGRPPPLRSNRRS
jgi:phage terminase small subunit